jgi:hypothetical protein
VYAQVLTCGTKKLLYAYGAAESVEAQFSTTRFDVQLLRSYHICNLAGWGGRGLNLSEEHCMHSDRSLTTLYASLQPDEIPHLLSPFSTGLALSCGEAFMKQMCREFGKLLAQSFFSHMLLCTVEVHPIHLCYCSWKPLNADADTYTAAAASVVNVLMLLLLVYTATATTTAAATHYRGPVV